MKFDSMDIVKAMQIIADSTADKLRLDKTIIGQIVSVENVETGEYRVAYEGNSFLAYSYDVKVSFSEGENVYVKIPENDMSNRKIIEGRTSSGSTLTDIVEQQVEINTIEPSLDKFYNYDKDGKWGIIAGVGSEHPRFSQTIFDSAGSSVGDHMFQSYAANYGKIKITASFLTKFSGSHRTGNYGLIVTFKTLKFDDSGNEVQGTMSYRLDFSSFVGDPYRYTSPSPQSVIIDIFKDSVIGLDSILFFQENFETDKSLNYDGNIIYENKGVDDPYICNIFVQDIDISFCEVIDLRNTSYYLTIATPQGIVFSGDTTSLTLDARLKYKGQNILAASTCKTYWYKENLSIKKGSENYDKLAGVRWEKINPFGTDFLPSLTIASGDVKTHARYKLVVIYQDVTLSKEIEVKQFEAEHDLRIRQTTKNNSRIVLQVVSNIENDDRDYFADWYFLLPDGSYDLITGGEKQSEIDVTDYLIYPTATFYCQTYYNNEPISIEHHNFAISDSQDDLSITYVGQDIYQYDANGDIAYEDTETDRTLGIKIEWKEGFGSAYSISYIAPDGSQIPNDHKQAKPVPNSMMENLWVDSTSILHYNIRQKYNMNYNNNVITVKIKCATNGNEYLFKKEILFLKDGDQGTNGTTYICAVRPVNLTNGDKLSGFHGLSFNGGWGQELNLRCYIYKNGDLLNGSPNFKLTFTWECGSKDVNKNNKLAINLIPGFTNLDDYRKIQGIGALDIKGDYVVKVTVKIEETSNNEDTEIHCQYPVDIAVGGLQLNQIEMNLPSYVKYTASGINAAFLNQELKCLYGGNEIPIYSTDESILKITNSKLDPAQKFYYKGGIAALRCEVTSSMYLLHPIMMYLDTYGNEAINGWDGTKLELDDNGKYILAPQIGAGKKNGDNTFTGVVMGQDTAEDKIGLYGYNHGIAHFGFKEDGTAFIGPSGEGQILFNGVKGTITSGNYTATTGMKIDLSNGHIDAYNFKISSGNMILDSSNQRFEFTVGASNNSRFVINHANGKRLFYVSRDGYYLQSQDYAANSQGTKINLADGRIDSYNFYLRSSCLTINSTNSRFTFDVTAGNQDGAFVIKAGNITLMNVSSGSYYLRSANYNGLSGALLQGVYINLENGTFKVGGNAEFNGTIRANQGIIGGWNLSENGLSNGDVYLYNDGSARFGDNCHISNNGTLWAQNVSISGTISTGNLTATGGTIGGWKINTNSITGGSTTLSSGGKITCKDADITGTIHATSMGAYEIAIYNSSSLSGGTLGTIGNVTTAAGNTGLGVSSDYGAYLLGNTNVKVASDANVHIEGQDIHLTPRGTIYLKTRLDCSNISASNQIGIYARFY